MTQLKYSDITEKIIGSAMRVHSKMRRGYVEAVYQKCLAIQLKKAGLLFQTEADHPIYYEGFVVGRRIKRLVNEKKLMNSRNQNPINQINP